jgi:LmbE family N-acetylglucosaminyl deacetylase
MPAPGSAAQDRARAAVIAFVRQARPALVLLPWRRDPHCDHRDSWALVTQALDDAGLAAPRLEYAIWQDEIGAEADHPAAHGMVPVFLAVSGAEKRHALAAHASQLGGLIHDDPGGFALAPATIARLTGEREVYWRCGAK